MSVRRTFVAIAAVLGAVALPSGPVIADTIIRGKVLDPISDSGVPGATVEIEHHGQVLTRAISDPQGRFRLSFPFPATPDAENVTILVSHDTFVPWSGLFVIAGGLLSGPAIEVTLTPLELNSCAPGHDPLIVVGHFRVTAGATAAQSDDLVHMVSDALTFSLIPAVQRQQLPSNVVPLILACSGAKPSSSQLADNYARSLRADVFVSGSIRPVDGAYDVTMALGDRFAFLDNALPFVNRSVALDDPVAAEMDSSTYAAILAVLANGYAQRELFDECVLVTVAAEELVGAITPRLASIRADCQVRTGMGELTGGGP